MSRTSIQTKTRLGLLTVALLGGVNLASSAFAVEALPQGYQLAAADKAGEGKCGEGKCGANGAKAKVTQAEGKCGEGKCGDASFSRTDSNHDGKVSRDEFLAVAKDRAGDFEVIDADHDGFISEGEAYQHLKTVFEAHGKPMPAGLFAQFQGDRH
ncbi:HvfA family oxazolone/thioamide-modified RiPP metallophore [Pseudomonas citronellolis]|uniref:HvfA family oxazolone/thioamide-modified RiPP metallophore n=1 Tax=Pseudomonas citronellolis TaxID=53408 RepID=UPI0023E3D531|nr:hypothetical protein [Pseudomonas citronellolis]MDF3933344.1 hypothetical protein [Pseudomonas citronellolis]